MTSANGSSRSTTTVSTEGRRWLTATRCAISASARAFGAVGPGLEVLPADQPHGEHVDGRGDRADPQHPGAEGFAGAAPVPGQPDVVEGGAPAVAAVVGPAPPHRPQPGARRTGRRRAGGPATTAAPPATSPPTAAAGRVAAPRCSAAQPSAAGQQEEAGVAGQPHQAADLPADGSGGAALWCAGRVGPGQGGRLHGAITSRNSPAANGRCVVGW